MRNMERKIVVRLDEKTLATIKEVLSKEPPVWYRERTLSWYVRNLILQDLSKRERERFEREAKAAKPKTKSPPRSAIRRRKSGTR